LRHAAGREVSIVDARRLGGRLVDGKTRPVLVTFHSPWDCRLVLAGARKLAGDDAAPELRNVYIKPDETVEERRRGQLKRLHAKSIREGKRVKLSENTGELYVNDCLVFSVKDGFVQAAVQGQSTDNGVAI
jgi:hypothetical protein